MTTRKSRDRKIIALLLVAIVVELVLLLAHSGVIHFGRTSATSDGVRAGIIEHTHNSLRRRSLNSLVWENSSRNEVVNFYDSILTLKESTAKLKLDNNTEVELSENTLITIDPPDEAHNGEIRLRFVRGNLSARNPYAPSKISNEEWSVELKTGSNVQLREVGEKGVEVQLVSGDAVVQSGGRAQNLEQGQILRVDQGDVSRMNVQRDLYWETPQAGPAPHREYLHGEMLPFSLTWHGSARQLSIQTLGRGERVQEIDPNSNAAVVNLEIGEHRLYLRDGQATSKPLDVQVWHAPTLHLLAPLPRNRVDVEEKITFVWQKPPGMAQFNFKIVGRDGQVRTQGLEQNTFTTEFAQEDDLNWYVEGIDKDGFSVPPLYRYPLFIRNKPLPAPKLRLPELRQPASDPKPGAKSPGPGAWLWNLLITPAYAEEPVSKAKFEAVFSWEPVEKADQYVIEISETTDFRNPVVNTTIRQTEFTWRGFALQKYYWRVAAGNSKGRMGVFSEPVALDFEPLKSNGSLAALDGVLIRKIQAAVLAATPPAATTTQPPTQAEATPPPQILKAIPTEESKIPHKRRINLTQAQESWRPIALWQPNYGLMQVVGTEDSQATLNGGSTMGFGFEMPWRDYRNALWVFDLALNYYSFTPTPKEKYPFQEDLNWLEFDVNATRYTSSFGFGVQIKQLLSLQRKDYEKLEADTTLWIGPELSQNYPLSKGEFNIRLSALFSRDGQGAFVQPEWRTRIGERFITGVGADAAWLLRAPNTSLILRGFVTIGFPF